MLSLLHFCLARAVVFLSAGLSPGKIYTARQRNTVARRFDFLTASSCLQFCSMIYLRTQSPGSVYPCIPPCQRLPRQLSQNNHPTSLPSAGMIGHSCLSSLRNMAIKVKNVEREPKLTQKSVKKKNSLLPLQIKYILSPNCFFLFPHLLSQKESFPFYHT